MDNIYYNNITIETTQLNINIDTNTTNTCIRANTNIIVTAYSTAAFETQFLNVL